MADITQVQGLNTVTQDTREQLRQAAAFSNSHDVVGDAGFNKALGVAQGVMSLAGPVLGAASPFMGVKGSMITGAAMSGILGPGGQMITPGATPFGASVGGGAAGMPAYGVGKSLAMPGTAPGFQAAGPGGMPGGAPGFPGAAGGATPMGSSASQFDAQINAMQTQQVEMLGLQARVQNISQVGQMMSNIAKTDSDAKLNAIRNIRS